MLTCSTFSKSKAQLKKHFEKVFKIWSKRDDAYCLGRSFYLGDKPSEATMKSKQPKRKSSLVALMLVAITLSGGIFLQHKQYPSIETRRELSVDGIFWD